MNEAERVKKVIEKWGAEQKAISQEYAKVKGEQVMTAICFALGSLADLAVRILHEGGKKNG